MSTGKNHNLGGVYESAADIERLVSAFENCVLPRAEWNHLAHLTVGMWYLLKHPKTEATSLIREGIKRYNHSVNIVTTRTGGYHETITLFYIELIHAYLSRMGKRWSIVKLTNQLLVTYGDKRLPLEYYTEGRLMSWEARKGWLPPDLKPLEFNDDSFDRRFSYLGISASLQAAHSEGDSR